MAIKYSNWQSSWDINHSAKARLTLTCQYTVGINKNQKQKIVNGVTCDLILLR
jgi:hypothetical protein